MIVRTIIETIAKITTESKVSTGVISAWIVTMLGSVFDVLPSIVTIIGGIVTICLSVSLLYFHNRRDKREEDQNKRSQEMHDQTMLKMKQDDKKNSRSVLKLIKDNESVKKNRA